MLACKACFAIYFQLSLSVYSFLFHGGNCSHGQKHIPVISGISALKGNEWQIGMTVVTQLFFTALAGTGVSAAQADDGR